MKILCVGKTDPKFAPIIDDFAKRLPRDWRLEWRILPYSRAKNVAARREESAKILEKIDGKSYVILLDERGTMLASPDFSRRLTSVKFAHDDVIFVLGGAYGVDENLRARANFTLSFSRMVFPHQIARLVLVEQIYRAFAIARNLPYHHA